MIGEAGGGGIGDQHLRLLQGDPHGTRRNAGEHDRRNPEQSVGYTAAEIADMRKKGVI